MEKKPFADEGGQGLGPPPGGKKPFADEGGQGLGPPPGGKKPFADEGGQGLGPPPGGKKPFADEGDQGLGPPLVLVKNPENRRPPRTVDFNTKKSHFELGPGPILGSPSFGVFWGGPPGGKNHLPTKGVRV